MDGGKEKMEFKIIGDILELQRGYDLPVDSMNEGNIPVVGSNGIIGYHNEVRSIYPTITMGRSGSIGKVHFYDKKTWVHNTALYVNNFKNNNPLYLYYLLKNLDFENLKSSSVVPSLNRNFVYPMKVPYISNIEEQRKISIVLGNIDQKIALNTRMNAELEAMAKQLYDYWFVQFDFPDENGKPYKSSGGKMMYNEILKREVPEGWEVKNLFYIANYHNGLACQKYRPNEGEEYLPVIKISEMHNGFTSETEKASANIPEVNIVDRGDVLFAWSASLEVMLWGAGKGALNQHIFKVTSNNGFPKSFFYFQLLEYVGHFKKIAEAKKTTMGHITQDHLEQSKIVVPPTLVLPQLLEDKISSIMKKIVSLRYENIKLTHLRDSLLPMLMNGQVTIG